jgi:hypothetical protein
VNLIYPVLIPTTSARFEEFISFWESLYSYSPKHPQGNKLYFGNIDKKEFTTDELEELFIWKNGMNLSGKKRELVGEILKRVEFINDLKTSNSEEIALHVSDLISKDGIWQIYLLHIIKPDFYPIFDQHTYRAYQYIKTGVIREISELVRINNFYIHTYLPFIHEKLETTFTIEERKNEIRKMDRALFAFGKFLKSSYVQLLGPTVDFEFLKKLFSSVYAFDRDQYSESLKKHLMKNPVRCPIVERLFKGRDFYMNNSNYNLRWDMGYFLMEQFKIEFEQSEGSELIFSLCCALKDEYSLSNQEIGSIIKEIIQLQTV